MVVILKAQVRDACSKIRHLGFGDNQTTIYYNAGYSVKKRSNLLMMHGSYAKEQFLIHFLKAT